MSGNPHESLIKTPKQRVTVLVLVVTIVVIVVLAKLATSGRIYDKDSPAMSPEEVAKRIKPVAEVDVRAAESAAPAGQAAGKADGKKVYESTCIACHGAGIANAPKFGDKAAWAPLLVHGAEHLYEPALKGKGAMPPRGGNLTLSDAEVKAAVNYLVGAVK